MPMVTWRQSPMQSGGVAARNKCRKIQIWEISIYRRVKHMDVADVIWYLQKILSNNQMDRMANLVYWLWQARCDVVFGKGRGTVTGICRWAAG